MVKCFPFLKGERACFLTAEVGSGIEGCLSSRSGVLGSWFAVHGSGFSGWAIRFVCCAWHVLGKEALGDSQRES